MHFCTSDYDSVSPFFYNAQKLVRVLLLRRAEGTIPFWVHHAQAEAQVIFLQFFIEVLKALVVIGSFGLIDIIGGSP